MKPRALLLTLLFAMPSLHAAVPGGEALASLISGEFNTNSDNKLDAGEWQTGIGESFGKLDANGDGSIAPDETDSRNDDIASKTGDLAALLVVGLIKQVIASLDTDGDKLVSRKEYDQLSLGIFTKLDVDKNNRLSQAELADLPLKLLIK